MLVNCKQKLRCFSDVRF